MKTLLMFIGLLLVMSMVKGKHLHPRSLVKLGEIDVEDDNKSEKIVAEMDGMPIEVLRNIRQNRFVPINSVLSFLSHPPCEDGMERDYIGVCREVWD